MAENLTLGNSDMSPATDKALSLGTTSKRYKYSFIDNHIAATAVYLGDMTTAGSWRMRISGTDIVFERLEGGSWVQKGTFTA